MAESYWQDIKKTLLEGGETAVTTVIAGLKLSKNAQGALELVVKQSLESGDFPNIKNLNQFPASQSLLM